MTWQSDFHSAVYSTARELGANDVQARLAAAQASEETGYGKSMVGNNAFGVKAATDYAGPTVTAGTNEEYNGQMVRENASFRAYDSLTASVKDYLGVVQQNFPDAWSAPTFAEAVKGLNTGVYGKYATNSDYANNITSIDSKLGATSYAANPENVPAPYGPNDSFPTQGLPSDLAAISEPDFRPIDPATAYAANPENVPAPSVADRTQTDLLSAYQPTEEASSPFDAALNQPTTPGEWGINNGVAPALMPTVEGWSAMAAAPPVQADISQPSYNVPATASLESNPGMLASAMASPINPSQAPAAAPQDGFSDLASAGPFGGQYASPQSRMGLAEPGFDMSRFGPETTPDTSSFDASRFGPISTANFDPSRFGPQAIDPATNTQSVMSAPPADLGSFPEAMAAQRMPATGIYSPEHLAVQAQAERQLAAARAMQPGMSVPATASLATNPALDAAVTANPQQPAGALSTAMAAPNFTQALNPSMPGLSVPSVDVTNAYAEQPNVTPAESAINSVTTPGMTPSQIGAYTGFAASALPGGITNLSGNTLVGPAGTATANFAAPPLNTIQVAEQPSIADPVNTPAVTQQAQQNAQTVANTAQASQPAAQNKGMLSGAINPGTAMGGIAGALAAGPLGGIIGAIIGNQIATNGLPSASANTTLAGGYLGAGPSAMASVYGGAPTGSYATANDGSTVSSTGGGWTTRTTADGVTTSTSPWGGGAGFFGGDPEADAAA